MQDTNYLSTLRDSVTVIVPTTCQASRTLLLHRAIESICAQYDVNLEVLIIVNGNRYDQQLMTELEEDARLRVIRLEEANVSSARYEGAQQAAGDFFCFLDDDDEFLPHALSHRVNIFHQYNSADVVVTNGYEHRAGSDTPLVAPGSASKISESPGESFLRSNWFASPAALFRARSIDPELFNFSYKYFEWTYLFFLLLSKGKRICYDEAFSYRKYEDNPLSVSKSIEYSLAYPEFLLSLAKLDLEPSINRMIQEKYLIALNSRSVLEMQQGSWGRAWRSHLKCLLSGGWRYLPFTRKLLINKFQE
jgi:glycosyltransferase involved in cell wall biosynthesis